MKYMNDTDYALSVSQLNERIKALLETHFSTVFVRGEISQLTNHSSGHKYFSIKDENSRIGCALWRSSASGLKFSLEEGLSVIIRGEISLYMPRGEYKLICKEITPDGIGALMLAYEQLKKRLQEKGYFEESRKKSIPRFIKHIAIVTSSTGAALQDMLKVANKRWNLLKITLIDSAVQGEDSHIEIARAIKVADEIGADVIIIGRGGGSLEDLWAFNEEAVADAVFFAKTPIISAVGHEVDFLISDFVADKRAPTPSAAMEMILPDQNEIKMYLDELEERMDNAFKALFSRKKEILTTLYNDISRYSFENKIKKSLTEVDELLQRLNLFFERVLKNKNDEIKAEQDRILRTMLSIFALKQSSLETLLGYLKEMEPSKRVKKGFAQITKKGKIAELSSLKVGELIELTDAKRSVEAEIKRVF